MSSCIIQFNADGVDFLLKYEPYNKAGVICRRAKNDTGNISVVSDIKPTLHNTISLTCLFSLLLESCNKF